MSAPTEPIRDQDDIRKLADFFFSRHMNRDYAMIVLGVSTALRISDLLRLTWDDVYDFSLKKWRTHIQITEHKTRKQKSVALTPEARDALRHIFFLNKKSPYIFWNGRTTKNAPISRVQAYRLIREACEECRISGNISCHSLRKTWGYQAWTKYHISPVLIMKIYNHTSYEITQRYLGLAQDEIDSAYYAVNLFEGPQQQE